MSKHERGQYVAEFSACDFDLREAQSFIDAYNSGQAHNTGGSLEYLLYEHEYHGVLTVPMDDIARLFIENPEAFENFFEEYPDSEAIIKEAAKDLPNCEPQLLGMVEKPPTPFA